MLKDYEADHIKPRPRSTEEELEACKWQLRNMREDLLSANEKIKGKCFQFRYSSRSPATVTVALTVFYII